MHAAEFKRGDAALQQRRTYGKRLVGQHGPPQIIGLQLNATTTDELLISR